MMVTICTITFSLCLDGDEVLISLDGDEWLVFHTMVITADSLDARVASHCGSFHYYFIHQYSQQCPTALHYIH